MYIWIKVDPSKPASLTWQRKLNSEEVALSLFTLSFQEKFQLVWAYVCIFFSLLNPSFHIHVILYNAWRSLHHFHKEGSWSVSKLYTGYVKDVLNAANEYEQMKLVNFLLSFWEKRKVQICYLVRNCIGGDCSI